MTGVVLVTVGALVLYGPGLVVGRLLRLRGLPWFALAPVITIAVAGISGPLMHLAGVPFEPWSMLAAVLLFAGLAALVGRRGGHPAGRAPRWTRRDLVVLGCVAFGGVVGALPVARAMGWAIDALSQSWDSPVHANLISYIAGTGTGDWSVTQDLTLGARPAFYPVGLHLVEAMVVDVTGRPAAWVYNAFLLLTPVQLSLSAAAVGTMIAPRRAMTAGVAAVAVVIPTFSLYFLLLTQPYSWTVALTGAVLAAFLQTTSAPSLARYAALALAIAGLFALQPSGVAGFAVLAGAWLLAARVPLQTRVRVAVRLAAAGLAAVLACLPELWAGSRSVAGVAGFDNKLSFPLRDVLAGPLLYGVYSQPQWMVAIAVAVAALVVLLLRRSAWWLLLAHLVFVVLYLVAHLLPTRLGHLLTGLWYNDPARLVMLFSLTGTLLVAVAATEVADRLGRVRSPVLARRLPQALVAGLAVLAVVAATVYVPRNTQPVDRAFGNGPSLTYAQRDVLERLPQWLGPGQRLLNDPWHGSVWAYVYSGVLPVQSHYGDGSTPAADLVLRHFDELDTRPDVAQAVVEQRICAVYVGTGSVVPKNWTWTGMDRLDAVRSLRLAYSDGSSRVYLLQGPLAQRAHCGPGQLLAGAS
ncbi:MAG TPA: DUF6541 family protein [Intrasporangium sp.]|uniref:DUF6541 family protein n=1 Tax=Intrasporangium sp. TaxID=1925024 RepID=UPI002D764DC3|nr:DUF6541 family protein [Intrasporangium sp.]HET7399938.1 DUF6541 family protein [Intrasporangium sp.]